MKYRIIQEKYRQNTGKYRKKIVKCTINGEYFGQKSLFLPHPPNCRQRYFFPVFADFFAQRSAAHISKVNNMEKMARSAEIFRF